MQKIKGWGKSVFTLNINDVYKLFIFIFIIDFIFAPLAAIIAWSTSNSVFFHVFKISFIGMFIVVLIFHFFHRIKKDPIILLFLFYSPLPIVNGLIINGFNKATLSHMYGMLLPILGISFGKYFAQNFNERINLHFRKAINYSFWIVGSILVLYFVFNSIGYINYFGMSSGIAYYTTFYLINQNLFMTIISLFFALMTGKRVILIEIFFIFILYVFLGKKFDFTSLQLTKLKMMKIGLIFFVGITVIVAMNQGLLRRFNVFNPFQENFMSERDVYIATGGRNIELSYAIRHMNENPYKWILGGGIGERFSHPAKMIDDGSVLVKHYTHFGPFYFVLVYGLPFTIVLYSFLLKSFLWGLRYTNNYFYLIYAMLFLGSFSGALMLVDIRIWFFLGVVNFIISNSDNNINLRRIKNIRHRKFEYSRRSLLELEKRGC